MKIVIEVSHDDITDCTTIRGKYFLIEKCKIKIKLAKRKHRCPTCAKLFKEKGNMITHIRTHVYFLITKDRRETI